MRNLDDATRALLHLSLIDGIGPVTIGSIISRVHALSSWNDIYDLMSSQWISIFGVSAKRAQALCSGLQDRALLERELSFIERNRILIATVLDESYPPLLKTINTPPIVLYYRGELPRAETPSLSIIGSRRADAYAKRVIETIVPDLVSRGWTIISGGAHGADSMAHRATVHEKGKTVVILGSGLLRPYPRENIRLFDDVVAAGGAVVSALPLEADPVPGNFPARNRIIAGMSSGCLVVQAARRSGASITATYALEQGREVFAVPGPVDSDLSAGCHMLLREGATLVEGVEDILEGYGISLRGHPQGEKKGITSREVKVVFPEKRVPTDRYANRSSDEQKVLRVCMQPRSIDFLLKETSIQASQLREMLCDLQLEGLVDQDPSGLWTAS